MKGDQKSLENYCGFLRPTPQLFLHPTLHGDHVWMLNKHLWISLLKVVVVGPPGESYERAGWYWLMKGTTSPPLRLVVTFPQWVVNYRMLEAALVCCRILGELSWVRCTEGAQHTFIVEGGCLGSWSLISMVHLRRVLNSGTWVWSLGLRNQVELADSRGLCISVLKLHFLTLSNRLGVLFSTSFALSFAVST